jgi:hypothetical protein
MSEAISLREQIAQAELAATNLSAAKVVSTRPEDEIKVDQ